MINLEHSTSIELEIQFLRSTCVCLFALKFLWISLSALCSSVCHAIELVGHGFYPVCRVLPLKRAAEEKAQAIRAAAVSSFKSMLRDKGDITTSTRWSRVGAIIHFYNKHMWKCMLAFGLFYELEKHVCFWTIFISYMLAYNLKPFYLLE